MKANVNVVSVVKGTGNIYNKLVDYHNENSRALNKYVVMN
jgi:hypothetical protein